MGRFDDSYIQRRSWHGTPLLGEYSDTLDIRRRLQAISPDLDLRAMTSGGWAVVQRLPGQVETLVGKYPQADQRLLDSVTKVVHPSYDYAATLEQIDADYDRQRAADWHEKMGEPAQKMAHAFRRHAGVKDRIYVP